MLLRDNFSTLTNESILLAQLHRADAQNLIDDVGGNDDAILWANAAIEHAEKAFVAFRAALELLPDMEAATEAKLSGDNALIESGMALTAARQRLESSVRDL